MIDRYGEKCATTTTRGRAVAAASISIGGYLTVRQPSMTGPCQVDVESSEPLDGDRPTPCRRPMGGGDQGKMHDYHAPRRAILVSPFARRQSTVVVTLMRRAGCWACHSVTLSQIAQSIRGASIPRQAASAEVWTPVDARWKAVRGMFPQFPPDSVGTPQQATTH